MKTSALLGSVLLLGGCSSNPHAPRNYEIRAALYEMPAALVEQLSGLNEPGVELRSETLFERARMAARSRAGVQTLASATYVTAAGVPVGQSQMQPSEWVQDYTVDAQWQAVPVQTVVLEGFEYELCPRPGETGLELQYKLRRSVLQRPVREVKITLSNGAQPLVHSLELDDRKLASSYELAEGEILAAWLPGSKPGRATLACVRATPAR
jgi:hypothetical protein